MEKLISVVIPTYNRAHLIERAIRSVLDQTYKNIECIVVDDGSTDDTENVVLSLADERIKYHRMPQNGGASRARNAGVMLATGDYIAFHDSDDVCRPDRLSFQMKMLEDNGVDVCIGRTSLWNPEIKAWYAEEGIISKKALYRIGCTTQTFLAKAEIAKQTLFDENLTVNEDYDWGFRVIQNHKIYLTNHILVDKFDQENSLTKLAMKDIQAAKERHSYRYKKYKEMFPKEKSLHRRVLRGKVVATLKCHEMPRIDELFVVIIWEILGKMGMD